jgi:LMBR1 domain-containing protein 1
MISITTGCSQRRSSVYSYVIVYTSILSRVESNSCTEAYGMASIHTTFIWVAYGVAVGLIALIAAIFTYIYQTHRDRSAVVSTVAIITLTSLLATILLLPVDIALVSSTNSTKLGAKKEWATPEHVDNILLSLKIIYYSLYSFDAILCLIICPFTYFWYEEYDEVEELEGSLTFGQRFWNAFKYTIAFIVLVVILFLVGFFVPIIDRKDAHLDLDYFKRLLTENRGERALTFALGLLISLGTLLYVLYTATGLALMPISFIKSAPAVSSPQLAESTAAALERNRERQRQLEGRSAGRRQGLHAKDKRELEALIREERTLVRRERLANEAQGKGKSAVVRAWNK